MKALLLCAGRGKRLQPITSKIPKALVPIGNITLIEHAVMSIKQAGITEIGIVINGEIKEYNSIINNIQKHAKITIIKQENPMGTGHAVQSSFDFLEDSSFLVYLADNLFGESLKEFVDNFLVNKPQVQIGAKKIVDPKDYGVLELSENNTVLNIEEKPEYPKSERAIVGVFAFDNSCKNLFENLQVSSRGELEITEALNRAIEKKYSVKAYEFMQWWVDVGNINRLIKANSLYLQEINKVKKTVKRADSIIKNCLMIEPVMIGKSCTIENSIIGPNVTIGDNVIITDSKLSECIVMDNSQLFEAKQIKNSIVLETEIVQI